jgi:death on curing protein
MRYLSVDQLLELHRSVIAATGGAGGVRDLGAVESAVNQPRAGFGGENLYPDLAAKAAALCFSLVCNHPFVDGNKRVGHAAMEVFLMLNGHEIVCHVDEQERVMLELAAGAIPRDAFTDWVRTHTVPAPGTSSG